VSRSTTAPQTSIASVLAAVEQMPLVSDRVTTSEAGTLVEQLPLLSAPAIARQTLPTSGIEVSDQASFFSSTIVNQALPASSQTTDKQTTVSDSIEQAPLVLPATTSAAAPSTPTSSTAQAPHGDPATAKGAIHISIPSIVKQAPPEDPATTNEAPHAHPEAKPVTIAAAPLTSTFSNVEQAPLEYPTTPDDAPDIYVPPIIEQAPLQYPVTTKDLSVSPLGERAPLGYRATDEESSPPLIIKKAPLEHSTKEAPPTYVLPLVEQPPLSYPATAKDASRSSTPPIIEQALLEQVALGYSAEEFEARTPVTAILKQVPLESPGAEKTDTFVLGTVAQAPLAHPTTAEEIRVSSVSPIVEQTSHKYLTTSGEAPLTSSIPTIRQAFLGSSPANTAILHLTSVFANVERAPFEHLAAYQESSTPIAKQVSLDNSESATAEETPLTLVPPIAEELPVRPVTVEEIPGTPVPSAVELNPPTTAAETSSTFIFSTPEPIPQVVVRCTPEHAPLSTDPLTTESADYPVLNVVVFGESGAGKSSVVNLIAGRQIAHTSSNGVGRVFQSEPHFVHLDGMLLKLWDTSGLNEEDTGTVIAKNTIIDLYKLLTGLEGEISLLVYCVRGPRIKNSVTRNYRMFYHGLCQEKAPMVLVVTGLEGEDPMDAWWPLNEDVFQKHQMVFSGQACVTATRGKFKAGAYMFEQEYEESRKKVQKLVGDCCRDAWLTKKATTHWMVSTVKHTIDRVARVFGVPVPGFGHSLYEVLKDYGGFSEDEARRMIASEGEGNSGNGERFIKSH
jgi:hypothetical protein